MVINLQTLLTCPPPEPAWLVPQLLTKGSLVLIAGSEGVGKSVLGYTLALAAASGTPFLGRPLAPIPVCYFDEENSLRDIYAYVYRAWVGLGRPVLPEGHARLHTCALGPRAADTLARECERHHPQLIIIDTATPAFQLTDENSNAEAAKACRAIRRAQAYAGPDCTVLIYKHLRHTERGADIRGAKHWKGAVDAILYHQRGLHLPNGFYQTVLSPQKIRAFGPATEIIITPDVIPNGLCLRGDRPRFVPTESIREEARRTGQSKSVIGRSRRAEALQVVLGTACPTPSQRDT